MIHVRAYFTVPFPHQTSVTLDARGCSLFSAGLMLANCENGTEFQVRDIRKVVVRFYAKDDQVYMIEAGLTGDPIDPETIARIKKAGESYVHNTRKEIRK